jgi:uncharacterized membrane protein
VKYREEAEAVSFTVGVILIPVGLYLWLSRQPSWDAYLGETLYMIGFSSLVGAWFQTTKRLETAVVVNVVVGLALSIAGVSLNEAFQTHGYEPMLLSGLGLLLGISFALYYDPRVRSVIRKIFP